MRILNGDCLDIMQFVGPVDCVFADPPDNIGLRYDGCDDAMHPDLYGCFLEEIVQECTSIAPIVWISFNARWVFAMGVIFDTFLAGNSGWSAKVCVQVFTFGQHNSHDLGNDHRPIWRLKRNDAPLYPNNIRVISKRQQAGDKRANPDGRVPGDVFDFPRVVGNSRQRRAWHPTQLNEYLVERCVKLSTRPGDLVLDPFGGTGTTMRVCRDAQRECILIEQSETYCKKISDEHKIPVETL